MRKSTELIPKEGSPLGSDITYPETRQPGRPLGTTRHIRGPRPDAALTIVSVNRIAINRGGALMGGIRLLHNQKGSAFGLVRAVRSPNAAQNVQAASGAFTPHAIPPREDRRILTHHRKPYVSVPRLAFALAMASSIAAPYSV